jgi:hypothetical protein
MILRWTPRAEPLAPEAALGFDGAAEALARRLARAGDEALARLRGVAGDGVVAVLGVADDLPWVDGVEYVGRAPGAPSLLLPTQVAPSVPAALLERAVVARAGAAPIAVSAARRRLVSLAGARPIDRVRLAAWLARAGEAPAKERGATP